MEVGTRNVEVVTDVNSDRKIKDAKEHELETNVTVGIKTIHVDLETVEIVESHCYDLDHLKTTTFIYLPEAYVSIVVLISSDELEHMLAT